MPASELYAVPYPRLICEDNGLDWATMQEAWKDHSSWTATEKHGISYASVNAGQVDLLEHSREGSAAALADTPFRIRGFARHDLGLLVDQYDTLQAPGIARRAGAIILAKECHNGALFNGRHVIADLKKDLQSWRSPIDVRVYEAADTDEVTAALNDGLNTYGKPWAFAALFAHGTQEDMKWSAGNVMTMDDIETVEVDREAIEPDGSMLLLSCNTGMPGQPTLGAPAQNVAGKWAQKLRRNVVAPQRAAYPTQIYAYADDRKGDRAIHIDATFADRDRRPVPATEYHRNGRRVYR